MRTVVTGATGLLGEEVADWLAGQEGHEVIGLCGRRDLDVVDTRAVVSFMCRAQPDLIVHCAAERDMDAAERDPKLPTCLIPLELGIWRSPQGCVIVKWSSSAAKRSIVAKRMLHIQNLTLLLP